MWLLTGLAVSFLGVRFYIWCNRPRGVLGSKLASWDSEHYRARVTRRHERKGY